LEVGDKSGKKRTAISEAETSGDSNRDLFEHSGTCIYFWWLFRRVAKWTSSGSWGGELARGSSLARVNFREMDSQDEMTRTAKGHRIGAEGI
jgi:hypothetical protein